jgi:hypothetical protein
MNSIINDFSKKPQPVKNDMPKWWKESENYLKDEALNNIPTRSLGTIKACPAIIDFLTYGYVLFFPTDIYIDATKDKIEWMYTDINSGIGDLDFSNYIIYHDGDTGLLSKYNKDGFHKDVLKVNSFWGIKTDPGYSVFITNPQHRHDLPFRSFSAIVDTDVFPARFQYPLIFKKGFSGVIKAGTPLVQVMPFKREDFVAQEVDFNIEDLDYQVNTIKLFFTSAYRKLYWKRKKFF